MLLAAPALGQQPAQPAEPPAGQPAPDGVAPAPAADAEPADRDASDDGEGEPADGEADQLGMPDAQQDETGAGDAAAGEQDADPAAGAEGEQGPDAKKEAKEDDEPAPQLKDPELLKLFAPLGERGYDRAREILESAAARSVEDPAKTYFEWLVDEDNQATLGSMVGAVATADAPESAEERAGRIAGLMEVVVESEGQYEVMNEVALNATRSIEVGVPFIPPPAPPITSDSGDYWTPPRASTFAGEVDWMFLAILAVSAISFIGITVATLYFTWKYRHRKGHKSEPSDSHNDALEITWTVLPSIILVIMFILGWKGFMHMMTAPRHAMEVQVIGQKWNWTFIYPNGWADEVLHVPAGEPVRLVMRSEDVLHDFSLPAFRIKQDVVPRRFTKLWFQVEKPGVYRAFCAEYCGEQHSDMKTWVQVHGPGGYEKFLEKAEEAVKELPIVEQGKMWYSKRGCGQCHSVDGSASTGPTFKGIWGENRQFTDGTTGVVDEDYIRESILEPQAKLRSGYGPVMPTFAGKLKDWQIDGLIAYIKSLQ